MTLTFLTNTIKIHTLAVEKFLNGKIKGQEQNFNFTYWKKVLAFIFVFRNLENCFM